MFIKVAAVAQVPFQLVCPEAGFIENDVNTVECTVRGSDVKGASCAFAVSAIRLETVDNGVPQSIAQSPFPTCDNNWSSVNNDNGRCADRDTNTDIYTYQFHVTADRAFLTSLTVLRCFAECSSGPGKGNQFTYNTSETCGPPVIFVAAFAQVHFQLVCPEAGFIENDVNTVECTVRGSDVKGASCVRAVSAIRLETVDRGVLKSIAQSPFPTCDNNWSSVNNDNGRCADRDTNTDIYTYQFHVTADRAFLTSLTGLRCFAECSSGPIIGNPFIYKSSETCGPPVIFVAALAQVHFQLVCPEAGFIENDVNTVECTVRGSDVKGASCARAVSAIRLETVDRGVLKSIAQSPFPTCDNNWSSVNNDNGRCADRDTNTDIYTYQFNVTADRAFLTSLTGLRCFAECSSGPIIGNPFTYKSSETCGPPVIFVAAVAQVPFQLLCPEAGFIENDVNTVECTVRGSDVKGASCVRAVSAIRLETVDRGVLKSIAQSPFPTCDNNWSSVNNDNGRCADRDTNTDIYTYQFHVTADRAFLTNLTRLRCFAECSSGPIIGNPFTYNTSKTCGPPVIVVGQLFFVLMHLI
ncbi:hypothetical protein V1264_017577 [Littorina saxatilis]|uniref:Uncharacterized protein n=1 Tax=Littorina saxatilis TaxID=31220 RepID=A0AAN9GGV9_9CAEN